MDLSKLRVVVVDDDVFKARHISDALAVHGIRHIKRVRSQDRLWEEIYGRARTEEAVGLIVTDMRYPLEAHGVSDAEAGFRLIERMRREGIGIPVILCSSGNYQVPEILGCVWYNALNDWEKEFKEALGRLG